MRAGALRHQITIEEATETQDDDGHNIQTWSTFATVWGEFVVMKGSVGVGDENIQGDRPIAESNQQLRIRHLSGLTPKMRVSFDSRNFNIRSIVNTGERGREMMLRVTEQVS